MRHVKNTITGKRYHLPTNEKEVTLDQWQALVHVVQTEGDEVDATAAMLGIDREEAQHIASAGYTLMHANPNSLAAAIGSGKPKKEMQVFGEAVTVPKSWELCTLGQRATVLAYIREKPFYEVADKVLAVCLAPLVYGDSWGDHVEDLAEYLAQEPAVDTVPTASFFLARLLSTSGVLVTPFNFLLLRITSVLGVNSWTASAFLMLWTLSLKGTQPNGKNP